MRYLYGSQIIRKKVMSPGRFYCFDDKDKLKNSLRDILEISLGPEAHIALKEFINFGII
jgi:hypothetical protein